MMIMKIRFNRKIGNFPAKILKASTIEICLSRDWKVIVFRGRVYPRCIIYFKDVNTMFSLRQNRKHTHTKSNKDTKNIWMNIMRKSHYSVSFEKAKYLFPFNEQLFPRDTRDSIDLRIFKVRTL